MTDHERELSAALFRQQAQISELQAELALLRPERSPPPPPIVAWALFFLVMEELRREERFYTIHFPKKLRRYLADHRRRWRVPDLCDRAERRRCETNGWRRVFGMPEIPKAPEPWVLVNNAGTP